jgi:molecular chaperone GrpE
MARHNGKSDIEPQALDIEHELPPADETGDNIEPAGAAVTSSGDTDVQKLRSERDTLLDRLARLQAEFENARKRASREQQEFREYALTDALKALLPTLDSFERALRNDSQDGAEFRGGVELIYKQLQDALNKLGLRPVPATGEAFDPHHHEAIEMVDTTQAPDHQVLDELQRGYMLKNRLLRPAMVRVARNPKH